MRANSEARERWRRHIEDFNASGLSRKDYCAKHQINVYTLDYWREKFSPEGKKASGASWIPVKVAEDNSAGFDLRVGRVSVTVKPGFDRALLIELLQTIALC